MYHVLPPSSELVFRRTIKHIVGNPLSYPKTPNELAKVKITKITFIPACHIGYSLHEDFSTRVGVIHSIHIDKGQILISGIDGKLIDKHLLKLVVPSSLSEEWLPPKDDVSPYNFKIGYLEAKKIGIKYIQELHTRTVSYYGANRVRYTKTCVPRVSNIFIKSLIQVYLPILTVNCEIVSRRHQLTMCGNKHEIEVLESNAGVCEICGKRLSRKRLLCNSCGKVVCAPSFLGHSYFCEICGKTICKECTYWTRKYLLFKKKVCENCADKLEAKGKKVKKYI